MSDYRYTSTEFEATDERRFPETLVLIPNPRPGATPEQSKRDRTMQAFSASHNRAVYDAIKGRVCVSDSTPCEVRIIETLRVIDSWLPSAQEDYALTECVAAMISAAQSLLNWDCGRFDCGTLDGWLCWAADRIGWDLDNGERRLD